MNLATPTLSAHCDIRSAGPEQLLWSDCPVGACWVEMLDASESEPSGLCDGCSTLSLSLTRCDRELVTGHTGSPDVPVIHFVC